MKVLFVASGNSKTGLNIIVKNQGESLKKLGIDLDYFPITGKGFRNYCKHIPLLKKHLKKNKYDLIHAHYGLCGVISQLARGEEKLVVSFMGDDLLGEISTKGAGQYSRFGDLLVLINKFFSRKYDFSIVKSQSLSSAIAGQEKKAIIPNGVDINLFSEVEKQKARYEINFTSRKQLIILVANPNRQEKNYKLAERSLRQLNNNGVELVAVYSIEHEKLKYYYNAANLLLLTSYHEGSPNVIKEAMACNCPIVSTDVGDVKWVFGDTKGCYITSFDYEDIANKIKQALEFSTRFERTKGRERIIELELDSESVAKKIIDIYNKVLNR